MQGCCNQPQGLCGRLVSGGDLADEAFTRRRPVEDDGIQQAFLVPEELVDRREGAARPFDDVAECCPLITLIYKQIEGGIDDCTPAAVQPIEFELLHASHNSTNKACAPVM